MDSTRLLGSLKSQCHSPEGAAAALQIVLGNYRDEHTIRSGDPHGNGDKAPALRRVTAQLVDHIYDKNGVDRGDVLLALVERLVWQEANYTKALASQARLIEDVTR